MTFWNPPHTGQMMLNSDATCFDDGSRGLGFSLWDSIGQVLMETSRWIPYLNNPAKGEALAIIFALQCLDEVVFSKLEIESDNSQLILYLQRYSASQISLGLLVQDILSLSNNFV